MKIWLTVILLFCVCHSKAQYPAFHQYTTDNGLPTDEVYCAAQDGKGFVWLGTEAGLYRFNGSYFHQYSCETQQSAAISGVVFDSDGKLYCYNFSNQIFAVERDSMFEIQSWREVRGTGFPNIALSPKNQLYATSGNGFYWSDGHQYIWKKISGVNQSFRLWCDKRGRVWFTTQEGIYSVESAQLQKRLIQVDIAQKINYGNLFFAEDNSSVWLFSISGGDVFKWNENRFVPHPSLALKNALKERKVTGVRYLQNKYIITTYTGVVLFDVDKEEVSIWYPHESFSSVMLDGEENVWLTTLRNGIYVVPQQQFLVWNKELSGLPENRVTDVIAHGNHIYFSMQNGSVGILDVNTHNLMCISTATKADIRNVFYDEQNQRLLFNNNNTLYAWSNNRLQILSANVGPVKKMILLPDGYLVCTSLGAYKYFTFHENSIAQNITYAWTRDAVYVPNDSALYIATNNGLLIKKYAAQKQITDTLLKDIQVVALYQAPKAVYALSFNGEVWKHSNYRFTKIYNLPAECNVSDLLVYEGKMFIASSVGLWRIDENTHEYILLNRTSGLCSNDVQSIAVQNETLWLATTKGLQSIPLNFVWNKPLPKLYLKAIKTQNQTNITTSNIDLHHRQALEIFPEAVTYSSFGNFRYAYRLNSKTGTWVYTNASDSLITLSGITPGNFIVEVKAVDFKGRSSNVITLRGKMMPPFWQRWWFYLLLALCSAALVYVIFNRYVHHLKKKQLENLKRLELENELQLARQTALKAQMNPHFIFNVLTSIKSYIYQNEKKSAAEYLSKFSDLMRGILQMSSMPDVRLSDELETLRLYIELEAMLLEPPFEYEILADDIINPHIIKIPALLLQPFVENAFKHGLRHKKGNKKLTLHINKNDSVLEVIITDNGIGRKAAAVVQQSTPQTHHSFASEAIAKRIDLLNRERNKKIGLQYVDLDEGTQVVITIPILNATE